MGQRYTLSECYKVLAVDGKTFREWLKKANIVPTPSRADERVKYLTEEQVQLLADLHERTLPLESPPPEGITIPGSYKLLLEQVDEVQTLCEEIHIQVQETDRTVVSLRECLDAQQQKIEEEKVALSLELAALEEAHASQIEEIKQRIAQEITALASRIDAQQQQVDADRVAFTQKIATLEEAYQSQLEEIMAESARREEEQVKRSRLWEAQVAQQQKVIETFEGKAATLLEQQADLLRREMQGRHESVDKALIQYGQAQQAQMDSILKLYSGTMQGLFTDERQHTEQEMKRLEKQLQEERDAREVLATQVALLVKGS